MASYDAKTKQFFAILEWWKSNESSYPRLALIARQYCALVALSSRVEGLFSVGGQLLHRRLRLSPETLRSTLIARSNCHVQAPPIIPVDPGLEVDPLEVIFDKDDCTCAPDACDCQH
jgi:hypothetical protein